MAAMRRCIASLYYFLRIGNRVRKIQTNHNLIPVKGSSTYVKDRKNMNTMVPCPNQECSDGKVHLFVGYDIFWIDCPVCMGSGCIVKRVQDTSSEQIKCLCKI